ncbi:rho guanine nucleotide exchange factor 10-like protein [Trichonephila clavata]|uniref:Rho guanine nucleotide exchange factor 10-like protein n=1 Tax=Trichonephila clavata TaxID=2740835 RepID=A0A8X6GQ92_TRICU|nr:rho guanine nucleotide exchange factor 10-like protein [Trichonephila clavata]
MLNNGHEAKYAKVNRTMKDGSKEEFECSVAIEFYNSILRGEDLADQMANVYRLDRKPCKWWNKLFFRLLMRAVVNSHGLRTVNSNMCNDPLCNDCFKLYHSHN